MESNQFSCPHCNGEFAVEHLAAGQAVACPHCGVAVVLPNAPPEAPLPPEAAELASNTDPASEHSRVAEDQGAASHARDGAFDFLDSAGSAADPTTATQRASEAVSVRRLTREEKELRRTVRNLVLMIVGVVVLAVTAVVLSRV